jgi:hypothetical protein
VGAAQTVNLSSLTPVNGAILRNRISEPYVPGVYNLSRRLQGFYRDSPDDGTDQRRAAPSNAGKPTRRYPGAYHEQDSTMTKIDCLIEVAKKLREARSLAERSSDRALLYFIDMTLAHVCNSLDARSESKGAEDKHASLVKAAA